MPTISTDEGDVGVARVSARAPPVIPDVGTETGETRFEAVPQSGDPRPLLASFAR